MEFMELMEFIKVKVSLSQTLTSNENDVKIWGQNLTSIKI